LNQAGKTLENLVERQSGKFSLGMTRQVVTQRKVDREAGKKTGVRRTLANLSCGEDMAAHRGTPVNSILVLTSDFHGVKTGKGAIANLGLKRLSDRYRLNRSLSVTTPMIAREEG